MRGVAFAVDPHLLVSDLTHEVEPFNIWEAAYRLQQTYKYWPSGTVFVTVVDPGVGSQRKSLAVRTKSGHYFVGPDNGYLTLVSEDTGLAEVHEIDESRQRLQGSEDSYTFHGRDLYVYVGARLAAGQLNLQDVGPHLSQAPQTFTYQRPEFREGQLHGAIPVLDPNYGNVWTNLPKKQVTAQFPNTRRFRVRIFRGKEKVFDQRLPLVETFAQVPRGQPLLYFNSLLNLSLALNMDSFASKFKINAGPDWRVSVLP